MPADARHNAGEPVAIIGGGFGGSLLALKLAQAGLTPVLIEAGPRSGPGLAYGAARRGHRLNVPVQRMEPGLEPSFAAWLDRDPAAVAEAVREAGDLSHAFVPRRLFGEYLAEQVASAAAAGDIVLRRGRVVRLRCDRLAHLPFDLTLADGRSVRAARVVLATGNLPPSALALQAGTDRQLADTPLFVPDPWDPLALAGLKRDDAVLLIGTGLTMADMVMSLAEDGHRGPIHILSRRGLLPLTHQAGGEWLVSYDHVAGQSPLSVLRILRTEARKAISKDVPWQRVLDAVRPVAARIWVAWTLPQRGQFLRHLRPYWDVHRHRLAPAVAAALNARIEAGQVTPLAGRLKGFAERDGALHMAYARRGIREIRNLRFYRVINCTGPGSDLSRTAIPLFADLREQGLIRPDALRLGLDTDDARVIAADGTVSHRLFAIGTLTRPNWWEITAVPEMTVQINRLVRILTAPDETPADPVQAFVDLGAGI